MDNNENVNNKHEIQTNITNITTIEIPKRVFIVPYRNRIQHKFFFCKYMSFLLEDKKDYEIYFSHQCDSRTFNRGATRDIGFLAVKNKYPDHYKNITFIFNDVDTIPFYKIFDYQTQHGIVKHYYGFKNALGGIVVIKGSDFEKINGYPCYWGWGMEDAALQKRCEMYRLNIDRSNFYEIGKPHILQLFDGVSRIISKNDTWRNENVDQGIDGLRTIGKLSYTIDSKSDNPNDNIFSLEDDRTFYVNIKTFSTFLNCEKDEYFNYDLREPKRKVMNPDRYLSHVKKNVGTTDDWSNIPYYPTVKEKRQLAAELFIKNGKEIPLNLLQQIEKDNEDEIIKDVYNVAPKKQYTHSQVNFNDIYVTNASSRPQTAIMTPPKTHTISPPQPPPHIYSHQYANYVGARRRASATAKMRLGGVY